MGYPVTDSLRFPLARYRVNSDRFKTPCYERGVLRGRHLGEDIDRRAGAPVYCIGRGRVVYRGCHPGTKKKGGWGNIVIVGHRQARTHRNFYSLYGHLARVRVKKGDTIERGDRIGVIAQGNTPDNGYWADAHLHFAIYAGPWRGRALRGFWKTGMRGTKLSYWRDPSIFIKKYEIDI